MTNQPEQAHAHFDHDGKAVVIEKLVIDHPDVTHEARRWTGGCRGTVVDDVRALAGADLTAFAAEAIRVGAFVLSATGQSRETRALQSMLQDVTAQTTAASADAAQLTQRAASEATAAVVKATQQAQDAITQLDAKAREQLASHVAATRDQLATDLRRVFGGDNPELMERLQPVLERFGAALDTKVGATTAELLSRATRALDPSDPTSPVARHTASLQEEHARLVTTLTSQHDAVVRKVDELTLALSARAVATTTRTELAAVTPLKGDTFEAELHAVVRELASDLGDEYAATGMTVGRIAGSKKGDGVLRIGGSAAAVVLEMTDSDTGRAWGPYLDEAERNRGAVGSLGLVRTLSQNCGRMIRVLGPRRMVLTFDPRTDDVELLRTVLLLLRAIAQAAVSRHGVAELATADEKLAEALGELLRIDKVRKSAGLIRKNADTIERECDSLQLCVRRLVVQAREALATADGGPVADGITLDPAG